MRKRLSLEPNQGHRVLEHPHLPSASRIPFLHPLIPHSLAFQCSLLTLSSCSHF